MSLLSQQLTLRAFWLGVQNPGMSVQDVRSLAAEQLAAEAAEERERLRRQPQRTTPQGPRSAHDTLLARVSAFAGRLLGREREPDLPRAPTDHRARRLQAASAPPPAASRPRRSLSERVASAFKPKPEPKPPQQSLFASEDGHRAQVIPDEEYSKRFQDIPTRNYRESVARNERLYAEKRGYPPSRSSLVR
jgi:hypothetical protein